MSTAVQEPCEPEGHAVLDELHRCLEPGGHLVLVWNARDAAARLVVAHTALVDPFAGDTPRFATMAWHDVVSAHPGFVEDGYLEVANPTPMTRQGFVDRILSTSFIAALPAATLDEVRGEAEAVARSLPERFEYPYVTRAWSYRRRGS